LVTSTVRQARESLGERLRELRREAGLSGRDLANRSGWHSSKVSKIEYGKQSPAEADIRIWCRVCGVDEQCDDLIVAARDIEAMYVEWRRRLRTGTRARQEKSQSLEAEARIIRWYEPVLVPGLLHTPEYATAVLRRVVEFYEVPDDVKAGVAARMERRHILHKPGHRFNFIMAQQALWTPVGDSKIMEGQLGSLLSVMSAASVLLGIVPAEAPYVVPSHQFIMFDERLVHVEAISAEVSVTQPREIALYGRAFSALAGLAVYGAGARSMISDAMGRL
jgi:transcriptional regulator with XRE-family HTH domain